MATRKVIKADEAVKPRRRQVVDKAEAPPVSYFAGAAAKTDIEFVSSGCELIDQMLGGGYALGRVVNVVGDRSAGKTLLAIEACANFVKVFPDGRIRYNEAEAAFDEKYAEALGMPIDHVEFSGKGKDEEPVNTIERWYDDFLAFLKRLDGKAGLYVLDSLDAMSDDAEQKREIDDSSYGANKAKKLGELFRRLVVEIEASRCMLMVISQLRDKIGVSFGETQTRSGGRALDFYASHIIWLHEMGKMKRTIQGVERVVGVEVKARCKKNKVGLPFREAKYPILFGFGIDDVTANIEWLLEVKRDDMLAELGFSKAGYKVRVQSLRNKGGDEYRDIRAKLAEIVAREWAAIETQFLPTQRKY